LARLALRFIEFDAQDVESWSETTFFVVSTFWPSNWYSHIQLTNGKVSQERKSAYAAETDMLLPSRPSQRVIGIVRIWSWMQDKSAIVAISVKRDGAFRTVQLLESVKTHIGGPIGSTNCRPKTRTSVGGMELGQQVSEWSPLPFFSRTAKEGTLLDGLLEMTLNKG
jgi:hypothetical protein